MTERSSWKPKYKTMHALAIALVMEQDPDLKDKGFNKSMKAWLAEIDADFDFEKLSSFTPDIFKIVPDEGQVCIYEVEDSHPIGMDKMRKIVDLFVFLDNEGIDLFLVALDRYGNEICRPDLSSYMILMARSR